MKILFNDILQYSNLQKELKSPMLSEVANINNHLEIILDIERPINSIGIGNTNGTYFTIIFDDNEELVLIL